MIFVEGYPCDWAPPELEALGIPYPCTAEDAKKLLNPTERTHETSKALRSLISKLKATTDDISKDAVER